MSSSSHRSVAVLGCGNMGSAFARALAAAGYEVNAWNRTESRAQSLANEVPGVSAFADIADAVGPCDVLIACVTVYDVLRVALDAAGDLTGKTLINITTGSPQEALEMGDWARKASARYLDCVITVYPRQVGGSASQIMVAGPHDLWLENQTCIKLLGGGAHHVSEDLRVANVLDVGLVGAFYTAALTGFIEAAAYILDQGVEGSALLESAIPVIHLLDAAAEEAIRHISTDAFGVHDASVEVFGTAARAMAATIAESGNTARILEEAARVITEAEKAGLAELSLPAITKSLRARP